MAFAYAQTLAEVINAVKGSKVLTHDKYSLRDKRRQSAGFRRFVGTRNREKETKRTFTHARNARVALNRLRQRGKKLSGQRAGTAVRAHRFRQMLSGLLGAKPAQSGTQRMTV